MTKNLVLWLIIAAVLLTVFNNFTQESAPNRVSYSEFVQSVQRDQVRNIEVDGIIITGNFGDGSSFEVVRPALSDPKLVDDLLTHEVEIVGQAARATEHLDAALSG